MIKKKLFTLVLLISIALLSVGCKDSYSYQGQNTGDELSNVGGQGAACMRTPPPCDSLIEYQYFLETTELPDNFIFYENISGLGEFQTFIVLDYYLNEYSSYIYCLTDDAGIELTLYVNPIDNQQSASNIIMQEQMNLTDMRLLDSTYSGTYSLSEITYTYVRGKLLAITWQYQDRLFELCSIGRDPWLAFYPNDTSTVTGQLLNGSNAPATIASLMELITE